MSTILCGLDRQRCLSAVAGGSTCRQRCDGLPVTAVIFPGTSALSRTSNS
jgi:hypothetical protein